MDKARFGLFFMLLILLASRKPLSMHLRSHRFKGMCLSEHNCASVSHLEGFTGGKCWGFRRLCFCSKHC
ncbi:hypothetical protein JHK86_010872 [Glycine max]|nr:hypothetical protein JHK86_010872 [Glycine max]